MQRGGAVDGGHRVRHADVGCATSRSKRSTKGPADDTQLVSRHSLTYFHSLPARCGTALGITRGARSPAAPSCDDHSRYHAKVSAHARLERDLGREAGQRAEPARGPGSGAPPSPPAPAGRRRAGAKRASAQDQVAPARRSRVSSRVVADVDHLAPRPPRWPISRVIASTASATWQKARRCSAPKTRNGSSRRERAQRELGNHVVGAHARTVDVVEAADHRAEPAGARGVDAPPPRPGSCSPRRRSAARRRPARRAAPSSGVGTGTCPAATPPA